MKVPKLSQEMSIYKGKTWLHKRH